MVEGPRERVDEIQLVDVVGEGVEVFEVVAFLLNRLRYGGNFVFDNLSAVPSDDGGNEQQCTQNECCFDVKEGDCTENGCEVKVLGGEIDRLVQSEESRRDVEDDISAEFSEI